ncbi:unnamed protein product, partial [Polarella glacialis]
ACFARRCPARASSQDSSRGSYSSSRSSSELPSRDERRRRVATAAADARAEASSREEARAHRLQRHDHCFRALLPMGESCSDVWRASWLWAGAGCGQLQCRHQRLHARGPLGASACPARRPPPRRPRSDARDAELGARSVCSGGGLGVGSPAMERISASRSRSQRRGPRCLDQCPWSRLAVGPGTGDSQGDA